MTWFELTVQHEEEPRTAHVRVAGALDLSGAREFEDALRRVERDRPRRIVLDLGALEFLDSAGLARILALRVRCRRSRRELDLVDAPPVVRRLFGLAGLTPAR
jgi:anti-sigma B factor antagonist